MRMQDLIDGIKAAVDNVQPSAVGVLLAVFVSVLRVVYDREETSWVRILLESLICGSLTLAGGSAAEALGYGNGLYLFFGGVIGFMGSAAVRNFAYKMIGREISK